MQRRRLIQQPLLHPRLGLFHGFASISINNCYRCHQNFISIDCGSSLPYKDEYGVDWVGDGKYVQSGKPASVGASDSIDHVADTLRVFTTRKRNCYNIGSLKRGRVLVRASFYYGNYDGKSLPPTFALQFDGNHWDQVQTSSTVYYYYEVTYTMKRDSISVCLAQTKQGQFPFITALQVRTLESTMYSHVNDSYPLFEWRRVSFGSNTTIIFPDDPYDRIWSRGPFRNQSIIPVSSNASFGELTSLHDNPPTAVLKNAITARTPNASMELLMGFPSYEIPVYINWYFSEVTRLAPGQNRSFRIFKDNKSFSEPILPPYGGYVEMSVSDILVSNKTIFSLVPTNVSTLPPLINAMEVFSIGEKLTDGTNNRDVEGLASLQERFSVLQSWSGDPCLPSGYPWDWVLCSSDSTPRVTSLLLGDYGLSGFLPDFSSMNALQTIDLHNNSLRGPIPEFLGTLPNLKTLNLAKNQLNGTVPASLLNKKGLILTVAGNPDLCTSNTSCQIPVTAPPPPPIKSSSIKKKTNKILELLFASMIFIIL